MQRENDGNNGEDSASISSSRSSLASWDLALRQSFTKHVRFTAIYNVDKIFSWGTLYFDLCEKLLNYYLNGKFFSWTDLLKFWI